ncbi:ribosome quality control complex subunit TCF25 [Neocloeon triangulifer]|uniref:ribosome quality control complex subunit TCF25 n=1 Tax=Neocloeon triangulifer TaxID=2078957 RepID=UPI00286EF9CF|nr:ribosome quality control complex subunit TCF25 [Neocloeon triangulifer]
MSSRVLRKLQGDTGLPVGAESDPEKEEEEDDLLAVATGGGAKKKQFNVNRYDLLNQQSLSESEVKEDDDNETEPTQDQDGADPCDKGAKRKKKKKKKKATKPAFNQRSSEDNFDGDEIDQVNRLLGPVPSAETAQAAIEVQRTKELLSIENRNLNPNNELKRIFGVKIVQSEQRKKSRTRTHLRNTGIVTPKDTWPMIGKQGITMRYCEQKGQVQIFSYEHSPDYQQVQKIFLQAVESLNPDNVVSVIHSHPYHVDALLQVAELCKMSEDVQMAADLIERALYALEHAFHPLFSLAQGNCRLDYCRQENRALFIALFKHLTLVGQRACHRTALELSKVVLSLDPEGDPLAMVLVIDLYALRSRQFAWLVRLADEWEASRNLSQLPNIAYSTAVARFHLAQQGAVEMADADAALQLALIMFPGVLSPLLEKCSVQVDQKVLGHNFFGPNSQTSMPPALAQLVQLYVARCWPVWKEPELLPWLERNTHAVLARVDSKDPLVSECDGHRRRRYQGNPPRNITRHIVLADLKEVPPVISQSEASGPVMSFDPLPPTNSINIYERPRRPRVTTVDNAGALTLFFRSLLPTFNVNEPPGGEGAGAAAPAEEVQYEFEGENEGGGLEVRRNLASLMDMLRDLLRNIQLPDAPDARGDADVDSSGDDEPGNET